MGALSPSSIPIHPLRERSDRHPLKPHRGWHPLSEAGTPFTPDQRYSPLLPPPCGRMNGRSPGSGVGRIGGAAMDKDPAEQEMLARGIGNELTEIFVRYVHGEVDFAEATFAAYDVLEDLHVIASGDYELEEDGDVEDEYTEEGATEQQEDLAQEPARGS